MSNYHHDTVRRMVRRIDRGDLLLPNIQRNLVWEPDQILFLIDSLLRGYPISTMLVWHTATQVSARRFVQNFRRDLRFSAFAISPEPGARDYVLDGQQRLQAFYIALLGTYEEQVVHVDLLGKPDSDELRYALFFAPPGSPRIPLSAVPLRDVVLPEERPGVIKAGMRKTLASRAVAVGAEEDARIEEVVETAVHAFTQAEAVTYFLADAQERKQFERLEEVLEIFIRVNSGGTKLDWSDLLFSVVKSKWDAALSTFEDLLERLNRGGAYNFDKDDLLKMCLIAGGQGAKYDLAKLRGDEGERTLEGIRARWPRVAESVELAVDFVEQRAQIRSQQVLRSRNAVIPLVHYFYRAAEVGHRIGDTEKLAMQRWLYRVLLERQFGGQAVTLLNRCAEVVATADPRQGFPEAALLSSLGLAGEVRDEAVLDRGRRSPLESVLPLQVAYMQGGLVPPDFAVRHGSNRPEVDHIVPRSFLLRLYAVEGREDGSEWINNTGNYRLLEQAENRSKSAELPDEFYAGGGLARFRRLHLIPDGFVLDRALTVKEYERFVTARRALLLGRIEDSLRNRD